MGVEFHITRAEFWADNDDAQITSDEWLHYINSGQAPRYTQSHGLTGAQVIFIQNGQTHIFTERCWGLQKASTPR